MVKGLNPIVCVIEGPEHFPSANSPDFANPKRRIKHLMLRCRVKTVLLAVSCIASPAFAAGPATVVLSGEKSMTGSSPASGCGNTRGAS